MRQELGGQGQGGIIVLKSADNIYYRLSGLTHFWAAGLLGWCLPIMLTSHTATTRKLGGGAWWGSGEAWLVGELNVPIWLCLAWALIHLTLRGSQIDIPWGRKSDNIAKTKSAKYPSLRVWLLWWWRWWWLLLCVFRYLAGVGPRPPRGVGIGEVGGVTWLTTTHNTFSPDNYHHPPDTSSNISILLLRRHC